MPTKSKYKVILKWNLEHTSCPISSKRCTLVVWATDSSAAALEAIQFAPWGGVEPGATPPWTTHEVWLKVG